MSTMQNLANQDNPHVPAEAPALRSYNLLVGTAFMTCDEPDPRVWVVQSVVRDSTFERVYIWARNANMIALGTEWGDLSIPNKSFDLHYCDKVALVGICVNPDDVDDNNWGV